MLNFRVLLLSAMLFCTACMVNAASSQEGTQFPTLWASDINGENFHVRAADLNGDGRGEVVADSIYQSMFGKDGLVRAFYSNGSIYWTYRAGLLESAYIAPGGVTAVSAGGQGILVGKDGTAFLKRNMRKSGPMGQLIVDQQVYVSDLDGDGLQDLLGSVNLGQKGSYLFAWRNNGDELFERAYRGLEAPYSFAVSDLDGDKKKEVLSGMIKYSVNSVGKTFDVHPDKESYLDALNLDGSVRWSFQTDAGVTAIGVDDINGDGSPEILVGVSRKVYALDSKGSQLWVLAVDGGVSAIDFGDVNKDGRDEIFVGANKLYVLDSKGSAVWSYGSGAIYGLKAYDLDGDGQSEAIIGTNSVRYVETDGSLIWKSDSFNKVRGVDAYDVDGDGFAEIIAGCSDGNVRVFKTSDYLIKKRVEIFYQKALESSGDKKYGLCAIYASNATELSGRIGDSSMMVSAGNLHDKCEKYERAGEHMNKSVASYGRGDYANASAYIESALAVYREFDDIKNVNEASSLKDRIRLAPLAEEYMNYSRYYFAAGLYDNASDFAAQARTSYSYTGDSQGVINAALILENVSRMRAYEQIYAALNYSAAGFLNASTYLALANETFLSLNDTSGILAVQNASVIVGARIKDIERVNSLKSVANETVTKISGNMPVIVAFSIVGVIALLVMIAVALALYLNRGDGAMKPGWQKPGAKDAPKPPLYDRKGGGASLTKSVGSKLGGV